MDWRHRTRVRVGCYVTDHLLKVSPQGIKCLAEGNTVAVLLPALMLLGEPGPARALIDGGAAVALGTDFPGTSTAMSMPPLHDSGLFRLKNEARGGVGGGYVEFGVCHRFGRKVGIDPRLSGGSDYLGRTRLPRDTL